MHIKFTHYYNLKSTLSKLDSILEDFKFVTLGQLIKKGNYPARALE